MTPMAAALGVHPHPWGVFTPTRLSCAGRNPGPQRLDSCFRRKDGVKASFLRRQEPRPTTFRFLLSPEGRGEGQSLHGSHAGRRPNRSTAAQRYLEKPGLGVEARYKARLKDGNAVLQHSFKHLQGVGSQTIDADWIAGLTGVGRSPSGVQSKLPVLLKRRLTLRK